MENYIVSARKYRPSAFDSVIGQQALTTTLKNAINTGKLAHAYLFCGPRGVGKTTCARIFAKTINCMAPTAEGEACNQCESCQAFNEQRSLNIHELDAASNNSVDDIRQLVEQVRIPPQIGRYKVYIIDEVHMLSTSAFNAFLKTLEEPPQHAIFILATTEKHKILPTILSRCQIYDFNRISVEDIVAHLTHVAAQENITAEPEALNVIALKADGGMRDALSIFDQVVSFTQGHITYQSVIANLNVLDYEYYFKLTSLFLCHNISECLLLFNEILTKGFDGNHFITGLSSHLRDLLVSKDPITLPLLEVGASIRERYQTQAQECPVEFLYQAMKLSNDCDLNYRSSKNKRLLVELTLIQIAQLSTGNNLLQKHASSTSTTSIKPIFTQASASIVKATTTIPQPNCAMSQEQPQTPKATSVSSAQDTHPVSSATFTMTQKTDEKKTPVVKMPDLGISIKQIAQQNEPHQPSITQSSTTTTTSTEKTEILPDEESINRYWQSYAAQMPQSQTAIAKRMQSMHVSLTNDINAEITVENEIIAKNFQSLKPSIETYLREQLRNPRITLEILVTTSDIENHAYGRAEKFQFMLQKNSALLDLQKRFGLELY